MSDSTATPINLAQAKETWREKMDKLKVKFPDLSDSDLLYEKGKRPEMLERVQIKLGKTKEELNTIISEL